MVLPQKNCEIKGQTRKDRMLWEKVYIIIIFVASQKTSLIVIFKRNWTLLKFWGTISRPIVFHFKKEIKALQVHIHF